MHYIATTREGENLLGMFTLATLARPRIAAFNPGRMGKGSQLLYACQNPLRNTDGWKSPPSPRRSYSTGKTPISNTPNLLPLLFTLVLLANAAKAVDYQEEWEEEADVSCAKLRLSSVKVIFFHQIWRWWSQKGKMVSSLLAQRVVLLR